jgi:hypothetical protein
MEFNGLTGSVEPATTTVEENNVPGPSETPSESSPVLENTVSSPPADSENISPVENLTNNSVKSEKPARSNKQKAADKGSAEMLERLRNAYSKEFSNIPNAPKAKAADGRKLFYTPEAERNATIESILQEEKSKLSGNKVSMSANKPGANSIPTDAVERLMQGLEMAMNAARELKKNSTRKNRTNVPAYNMGNSVGNSVGSSVYPLANNNSTRKSNKKKRSSMNSSYLNSSLEDRFESAKGSSNMNMNVNANVNPKKNKNMPLNF